MRRQDNYFAELEEQARGILRAVDHRRPAHAAHGLRHRGAPRVLAALRRRPPGIHALGRRHQERTSVSVEHGAGEGRLAHGRAAGAREPHPRAQRAALVRRVPASARRDELSDRCTPDPEDHAVPVLQEAKARRAISIEDLRDAYSVSYETAAHRFTNLATRHLGIRVHFLKVHESGTITKAYENDDVNFPSDRLGSIEGQLCCRAGRAASCSTSPTSSTRTTSTPTPATARTGARRASRHPAKARTPCRWVCASTTRSGSSARDVQPRAVAARRRGVLPPGSRRAGVAVARPGVAERAHTADAARDPADRIVPGVDTTDLYEFLEAHAPQGEPARTSSAPTPTCSARLSPCRGTYAPVRPCCAAVVRPLWIDCGPGFLVSPQSAGGTLAL
jgi:hypothetical protein